MAHHNAWISRQTVAAPRLRLFCFGYAGASATAFRLWKGGLSADIEVCAIQLPGRGARLAEAPLTSLPVVVASIAREVAHHDALPFAFFGHSLGALLAFETARHLARDCLRQPVHLFASGSDAPGQRGHAGELHALPDDQLIDALRSYNGTPPEVLANRDLMALVLPAIRADFALAETYRYSPAPPLAMPVTVLAGRRDDHCTASLVQQWGHETSAECDLKWFDGDHFFIEARRSDVLHCINGVLARYRSRYVV